MAYPNQSIGIEFTGLRPGEKNYLKNYSPTVKQLAHRTSRNFASPERSIAGKSWETEVHSWLNDSPSLLDSDVRAGLRSIGLRVCAV